MVIVFQKSLLKSKHAKRIVRDAKLTYFKEKILEHLDKLEKKEKKKEEVIQKAFAEAEALMKAGFPVGTVRDWKGKKYMKVAPGKWRRKYDSNTRGARQSFAAIKRKVDACASAAELLQVVKENKHRFTDANGQYLPIVKELFSHVSEAHKKIKGASAKKQTGNSHQADVGSFTGRTISPPNPSDSSTIQQSDDSIKQAGGSGGGGDDGDGGNGGDKGLTPKQAANLKKISAVLDKNVEAPPKKIEFSKENFDRLFANGIDSPIEHIKIGENQYKKLIAKDRQGLLAVMADVMKDPALIMKTTDNAKLYAKTYSNTKSGRAVVSVIVGKGDINVSISTHIERSRQLAKKMDSILYEKTESVHGANSPHGANAPTSSTIQQSDDSVNKKNEKTAYKTLIDLVNDFFIAAYDPYELRDQIKRYEKNEKLYRSKISKMVKLRDALVTPSRYYNNDEEVRAATVELGERAGYLARQLHSPKLARFARDTLDFAQKHSFTELEDTSRKQAEKLGLDPVTYKPVKQAETGEKTAKPNGAHLYNLAMEQQAAYRKMMAKFEEHYEALRRANARAEERVRAFLKENKAIRGNQRVDRAHLDKVMARLSPEKREELVALYAQADKEERAKEADGLFEEYERMEADYKAIKEKADKARADFYKGGKSAGKKNTSAYQPGTTGYEEEPPDIPF